MENTLQHCIPLIRFFSLSSEDFFQKVHPYKKLLKPNLYEELLKSYLDPNNNVPSDCILLPRNKNVDGIIDSKIVNLNIVSIISRWIDNIDVKSKFAYTRKLYLPYEFKLLLRGSRDGFTPNTFHSLCDNKPHTVTFIKVKGTEEILGGYNPLTWRTSGETKDSYIFSFKNKDDFRDPILSHAKNVDKSIIEHSGFGPAFNDDLLLHVEEYDGSKQFNINHCRQQSYEKKIRDTEDNFLIEDYEVFQIKKVVCSLVHKTEGHAMVAVKRDGPYSKENEKSVSITTKIEDEKKDDELIKKNEERCITIKLDIPQSL